LIEANLSFLFSFRLSLCTPRYRIFSDYVVCLEGLPSE